MDYVPNNDRLQLAALEGFEQIFFGENSDILWGVKPGEDIDDSFARLNLIRFDLAE